MVRTFDTETLNGLCSEDQLELLDSIDHLRFQGVDHYISLPQIIVCGDQSSGKSSVLEALSGVPFPVKSNLCTCFPTELVLRRADNIGVIVSIMPETSTSKADKDHLPQFHEELNGFEGFQSLIEKAKLAMGISNSGKTFSKDRLRVEITGPDRPHLTIIDLPGLIHSETKSQSAADVGLVREVVEDYMKQPRSIILAVVSAKNDFANQVVLNLARQVDKTGNRTMDVITKPDTLVQGSSSESAYVSLARNNQVYFRLGWHVLVNLDSETQKGSSLLSHRNAEEARFFSTGAWKELPSSMLGIGQLRKNLSDVLLRQIALELPSLIREIDLTLDISRGQLNELGEPRRTLEEQRLQLLHICQSFQSVVESSISGTYIGAFFEDIDTPEGYQQRIRAIIQNMNKEFADELSARGHRREISSNTKSSPPGPELITSHNFNTLIDRLAKTTKYNTERLAASEAFDCMHAYYDIAMKRFVDSIAIEVIEQTLLAALSGILSPAAVMSMSPELVKSIAGESKESRAQRDELTKKIDALQKGSDICKSFVNSKLSDEKLTSLEDAKSGGTRSRTQ
ncbi:dynamin GTPase [Hypoxylon cercidicola]|nr:dynamin GTPase [Hypoxylon cercidicola]